MLKAARALTGWLSGMDGSADGSTLRTSRALTRAAHSSTPHARTRPSAAPLRRAQEALERTSANPPTRLEQLRAALLSVLLGAGAIMAALRLASPGLFGLAPFSTLVGISACATPCAERVQR